MKIGIKMKRIFLMMSLFFLTSMMFGQKKWTLQECIDYAMQNNITLQQARLQKQTATETRKQSQAALFLLSLPPLTKVWVTGLGWKLVRRQ